MSTTKWLWLSAAAALVVNAACGDDFDAGEGGAAPAVPCNEDPWTCTPPLSCWIYSDYTWQCMNVGTLAEGLPCNTYLGSSECATGLVCLGASGSPSGLCRPLCDPFDPERACATGTCMEVLYERLDNGTLMPAIHACRTP